MIKVCGICKKELDVILFHKDSSKQDGFRRSCKECSKQKKQRLRQKRNFPPAITGNKFCNKCKIQKAVNHFVKNKRVSDGRNNVCRECVRQHSRLYYQRHRDKIKKKTTKYSKENREKLNASTRKRSAHLRKTNPLYVLKRRLRNRLHYALKREYWKNNSKFNESIGCSLEELKQHMESKFLSGMSWDNKSEWYIDHKIPLSNATNEETLFKLCHYTNLQPLWKIDNIKKGTKTDICWQKLQRDRWLKDDIKNGYPLDTKARDFILAHEPFTEEHNNFIKKYEWLGTVGFGVKYVFTARYNGILGGVVMVSEPINYQFDISLEALIQHGACASWTPKNLGSRLVMFSCRWMRDNTTKRIFVGYSDPDAGEVGTIYQSCNFDFLGQNYGSKFIYLLPNGKKVGSRYFTVTYSFKKYASELGIEWKKEWIKPNGFHDRKLIPKDIFKLLINKSREERRKCPKIEINRRGKYVLLLTKPRENIKKTWEPQPYPKRHP